LLWYRGGRLEGTPEGDEILPGTTRQFTLTLAEKLEIPFKECRVTLDELLNAEEIILVGTTTEVVSVTRINETTIGGGRPGPIAAELHAAYEDAVKAWLAEGPRPRNQPVADDSRGR
jgi:D-alanine transaminase